MAKQATIRGGNVTPKAPAPPKHKPKQSPAGASATDPPKKPPARPSGSKRDEFVKKVIEFVKTKNALRRRPHGPHAYGIDTPLGMLIVSIEDGDPPVSLKLTSLDVAKGALGDEFNRYTGEWDIGLASLKSHDEIYGRLVANVNKVLGAKIVFPKQSQ